MSKKKKAAKLEHSAELLELLERTAELLEQLRYNSVAGSLRGIIGRLGRDNA